MFKQVYIIPKSRRPVTVKKPRFTYVVWRDPSYQVFPFSNCLRITKSNGNIYHFSVSLLISFALGVQGVKKLSSWFTQVILHLWIGGDLFKKCTAKFTWTLKFNASDCCFCNVFDSLKREDVSKELYFKERFNVCPPSE